MADGVDVGPAELAGTETGALAAGIGVDGAWVVSAEGAADSLGTATLDVGALDSATVEESGVEDAGAEAVG